MKHSYLPNFQRDIFSDIAGNSAIQTAANSALPGSGAVLGLIKNLFKNDTRSDWKEWDRVDASLGETKGNTVRGWVLNGINSVNNDPNEDVPRSADNIASYINANGITSLISGNPPFRPGVDYTRADGHGWRDVTIAEIAAKLRKGGKGDQANQLLGIAANASTNTSPILLNQPNAATPTAQTTVHVEMPSPTGAQVAQTGTASTDTTAKAAADKAAATKKTWLIVGIVGGVIVLGTIIFAVVRLTGKGK